MLGTREQPHALKRLVDMRRSSLALSRFRRGAGLSVAAALLAATAFASGCNSGGGGNESVVVSGPTLTGTNGTYKLDRSLRAHPAIRIASRVDEGWSTWDPQTHLYGSGYVFPASWKVALDGCQSSGPIAH